jgi:hypothetical protein
MSHSMTNVPVSVGQLVLRFSQINECFSLCSTNLSRSVDFWQDFVKLFFHETALFKYSVRISNNHCCSARLRTFEVGTEALPRVFQSIYLSEVKQVNFLMENPREYTISNKYLLFSSKTKLLMHYDNTTFVQIYGTLRVTFCHQLKILLWEFESRKFEEMLPKEKFEHSRDKIFSTIVVNEFGLPPLFMRYLEIAELIHYMKDLFDFSSAKKLSPFESLQRYPIEHAASLLPFTNVLTSELPSNACTASTHNRNVLTSHDYKTSVMSTSEPIPNQQPRTPRCSSTNRRYPNTGITPMSQPNEETTYKTDQSPSTPLTLQTATTAQTQQEEQQGGRRNGHKHKRDDQNLIEDSPQFDKDNTQNSLDSSSHMTKKMKTGGHESVTVVGNTLAASSKPSVDAKNMNNTEACSIQSPEERTDFVNRSSSELTNLSATVTYSPSQSAPSPETKHSFNTRSDISNFNSNVS